MRPCGARRCPACLHKRARARHRQTFPTSPPPQDRRARSGTSARPAQAGSQATTKVKSGGGTRRGTLPRSPRVPLQVPPHPPPATPPGPPQAPLRGAGKHPPQPATRLAGRHRGSASSHSDGTGPGRHRAIPPRDARPIRSPREGRVVSPRQAPDLCPSLAVRSDPRRAHRCVLLSRQHPHQLANALAAIRDPASGMVAWSSPAYAPATTYADAAAAPPARAASAAGRRCPGPAR